MSGKTVLVVAAHPDDEILGCGGSIARHLDEGDAVHVVFLADGIGAREPDDEPQAREEREMAARSAAKLLGVDSLDFLNHPDNRLDTVALLDLVKPIEQRVEQLKPSTVYTHHPGDLNVDHRRTCEATLTACRPQPGTPVLRILFFEVLSSTEWSNGLGEGFRPNWYVGIESQLDRKLKALECYALEMRESPHPRSGPAVEALARLRGSACGLKAAEAFVLHREINL